MAIAAGTIGMPGNDDWVYMLAASRLYAGGGLSMAGHTAATVGQLVLVQPLLWLANGAPWAYTAFGLGMSGLAIAAAFLLARMHVGPTAAFVAAGLLVASPGFTREAATFMTDGPTLALEMVSLLLGTAWLRSGKPAVLLASLAVGVIGVTIREFAVAAPAAVLVVSWARSRPGERFMLLGATVLTAAAILGILRLVSSPAVSGGIGGTPRLLNAYLFGPAMVTLAAGLLPVLAPAVARRRASLRALHLLFGFATVGLALVVPTIPPLVGQFWTPEGLVGDALLMGPRAPVIPASAWTLSLALAVLAGVLLAAVASRWFLLTFADVATASGLRDRLLATGRGSSGLLLVFAVGYAAELAVVVTVGGYPLDRYLWPLVPVLGILLVRETGERAPRWGILAGSAALLWLAASALAISANSFVYDAARWRAGEAAVAAGYAPATVDAGYEWVGYHTGGLGTGRSPAYGLTWYDDEFMPQPPCAVVANGPLGADRYRPIGIGPSLYRQYLLVGPSEPLYLYGSTDAGCPAPPVPPS